MSRIGKLPISIPEGVQVTVDEKNVVTVKGKLGELHQAVDAKAVTVKIEDGTITLERASDSKDHRAKHGLYRALIANMVEGVSKGFKIVQEMVGVGYKASVQGQVLELAVGFSHNIFLQLPAEIKVEAITERGKNPLITMTSADKQLVGQAAAKIRSLRKPEPYKGKGIKYQGEELRRKAGKTATS